MGEQKPTGLGDLRGHGPALVGWQPRITAPIKRRVRAATGFIRPLRARDSARRSMTHLRSDFMI